MKALKYTLAAATVAAISLASCQDEFPVGGGEGRVTFSPKFSADLSVESRADENLEESLILWVSNSKGVVRQYAGLSSVPSEVKLLAGSYLAEAWAGDSVSASWDKRWYKGQAEFEISNGATTDVEIKCKIANVAVRVEYADDVDAVLQDYTLQVGHSRGTLTFDAEHLGQRGYFMMPSRDRDLAWTLTGTKKADGATLFTRTATIANAQPGHEYVFKVSCAKGEFDDKGGAFLNIVIVDNVIEKDDVVYVPVTADPVVVNPVDRTDPAALTHNSATITAKVEMPDAVGENPVGTFYYRPAESRADGWNEVAAEYADGIFSAHITDLNPGTTYEYYLEVTSELITEPIVTNTITFATEPAAQLPNASFEDWQDSSAPYLIYGVGQDMFWDSGNHGSATMKKNVTVPDGSIFHSGERSIKLASQFVGMGSLGKFAAGNVFVGKYLKTDGTDGILGFGRPFTGRPAALRVWVKYKPVAITHTAAGAPEGFDKGAMDVGAIYVALWDSYTEEYNGEKYPIVIQTKAANRHLFDSQSEHIVAYGSVDLNETEGDDLVERVIPIDYRRTDVRPSYIIITCSASKAGDFFTGGSGSNMWLDDVELIYE